MNEFIYPLLLQSSLEKQKEYRGARSVFFLSNFVKKCQRAMPKTNIKFTEIIHSSSFLIYGMGKRAVCDIIRIMSWAAFSNEEMYDRRTIRKSRCD